MLFNSLTFLVFFACVLGFYHLPLSWTTKKLGLLIASYIFYAAWSPPFVTLLWISTVVDWYAARAIASTEDPWRRRAALMASLTANLGLLGYFKYGNFLVENFYSTASLLGVNYPEPPGLDIVLPVGISFYTFQSLSYTIDVYRRQTSPWKSFLDFALYVTFFPQLVAGPIVRATDFLPQCLQPQRATARQFGWGLSLLVLGLFQKTVVADSLLAMTVEEVFAAQSTNPIDAWIGTLAFSVQIFCDFSGYSTCAIGVAMCLGFALPDNFRFPYAAIGFSDFWRRWHISLSTWLRDYLYIPLGGNRQGNLRTQANLMLTMLIGGLWHGAAWNFVVWGGLHGAYLIMERLLAKSPLGAWHVWKTWPARMMLAIATYLLVCVTWTFFRAQSLVQASQMSWAMLTWNLDAQATEQVQQRVVSTADIGGTLATVAVVLLVHWVLRETTLEQALGRVPWPVLALVNALMLMAIITSGGNNRDFIYFQF